MRINATNLKGAEIPSTGYRILWDDRLKGFGARVTAKGSISFIAEGRVNGRTRRITIGALGKLTPDQARIEAKKIIGQIATGTDPNAEKAEQRAAAVTLGEVADSYKANRRTSAGLPLKPSTLQDIDKHLKGTFKDWQRKPVADIGRELVRRRYLEAAKRSTAQANQAMRILSALINYAREQYRRPDGSPLLLDNPVRVLRSSSILRAVPKRKNHIPLDQVGKWWSAVEARRADPGLTTIAKSSIDLLALLALTGLRFGEAAALRWDAVDLDGRALRLDDPKNRQAVTLPLSEAAHSILDARPGREGWIFPSRSGEGHIGEVRGALAHLKDATGVEITAHDLRRTFRAVAGALGIELWRCKALMNHKQGHDVTLGHYTDLSDVRNLKPEADRIGAYFEERARIAEADNVVKLERRA